MADNFDDTMNIRMFKFQKEALHEAAKAAGFSSTSDYIRTKLELPSEPLSAADRAQLEQQQADRAARETAAREHIERIHSARTYAKARFVENLARTITANMMSELERYDDQARQLDKQLELALTSTNPTGD